MSEAYDREDEQLAQQIDAARDDCEAGSLDARDHLLIEAGRRLLAGGAITFEEALKRLDAEVAAHEPGWTGADSLEDGFAYMDGVTKQAGSHLSKPTDPPPPHQLRFGERLRDALEHRKAGWGWLSGVGLLSPEQVDSFNRLAAAIDKDRDKYRQHLLTLCADQEAEHLRDLRRQVEEAVEGLAQLVTFSGVQEGDDELLPMVGKEDLLNELDRIFGDRAEGESTPWPLRAVMRRLCAAADHLLGLHNCDCHGYEEIKAAREAGRRWGGSGEEMPPERLEPPVQRAEVQHPGYPVDALEHGMTVGGLGAEPESTSPEPPSAEVADLMATLKASLAQHEPAHDRRRSERQLAARTAPAEWKGFDR